MAHFYFRSVSNGTVWHTTKIPGIVLAVELACSYASCCAWDCASCYAV